MKIPIEPEQVRKGDLIRREHNNPLDGSTSTAVEYVADCDGDPSGPYYGNFSCLTGLSLPS